MLVHAAATVSQAQVIAMIRLGRATERARSYYSMTARVSGTILVISEAPLTRNDQGPNRPGKRRLATNPTFRPTARISIRLRTAPNTHTRCPMLRRQHLLTRPCTCSKRSYLTRPTNDSARGP